MAYSSQSSLRLWWSPACSGPWARINLYGAGQVSVRPAIVDAVKALNKVLTGYKYYTRAADTGAYNCRKVTGGSTWSLHAYGIAVDINWQSNPYGSTLITDMFRYGDGRMPYRIEAIRTNNGKQVWRWGGWFPGNRDAMHYEITCSPSDLRTGINWSTVYGGTVAAPKPITPTGDLVYRIYWFKGEPTAEGDQTDQRAAYRCLCAKAETTGQYYVVSAWWIRSMEELAVWKKRGLKETTTSATPRASIQFYGGPFDNTKVY